jgi:hypothetical protein
VGSGGSLEPIRGFANKLPEHAARVAGVLGIVADPRCTEITSGHIDAGIALAQHYAMEALRLFDAGSARPEILRAEQLLDWLNRRDGELISLPDVYQSGRTPSVTPRQRSMPFMSWKTTAPWRQSRAVP